MFGSDVTSMNSLPRMSSSCRCWMSCLLHLARPETRIAGLTESSLCEYHASRPQFPGHAACVEWHHASPTDGWRMSLYSNIQIRRCVKNAEELDIVPTGRGLNSRKCLFEQLLEALGLHFGMVISVISLTTWMWRYNWDRTTYRRHP